MYKFSAANANTSATIRANCEQGIDEILKALFDFFENRSFEIIIEDGDTGEVLFWRDSYDENGIIPEDFCKTREFMWMVRGYRLTY